MEIMVHATRFVLVYSVNMFLSGLSVWMEIFRRTMPLCVHGGHCGRKQRWKFTSKNSSELERVVPQKGPWILGCYWRCLLINLQCVLCVSAFQGLFCYKSWDSTTGVLQVTDCQIVGMKKLYLQNFRLPSDKCQWRRIAPVSTMDILQ